MLAGAWTHGRALTGVDAEAAHTARRLLPPWPQLMLDAAQIELADSVDGAELDAARTARDHIRHAVELDSSDPTLWHRLGRYELLLHELNASESRV